MHARVTVVAAVLLTAVSVWARPDAGLEARLRAAGRLADDTVVLRIERLPLGPDHAVIVAKLRDRTGRLIPAYFDETLRPVDPQVARRAAIDAYNAANGRLHHRLVEHLATTRPGEPIPVAVWLDDPDLAPAVAAVEAAGFALEAGKPTGPDARAARQALFAAKTQRYAAHNAPVAQALAGMGGQIDHVATSAPLVLATLTPAQIRAAEGLAVQRIYLAPLLGKKMDSVNAAAQNTQMKAAGHTGNADIKVAIVDCGHPVWFANQNLDHLNGMAFNVTGNFDEHGTLTAGIVAMKGNPPVEGIAPDVNLLSANFATAKDGVYEPAAGGNGTADTTAAGDDFQLVQVGNPAAANQRIIHPGPNSLIDSTPAGDDEYRYGPAGFIASFVSAVEWAIGEGADVLNMSLGEPASDLTFDVSDKYVDHIVFEHFIAVVVAAGNECDRATIREPLFGGNGIADTTAAGDDNQVIAPGQPAPSTSVIITPGANEILDTTPAGDDLPIGGGFRCRVTSPGLAYSCITVGAIDDRNTAALGDDTRASYSNHVDLDGDHEKPEISAPGSRVFTTTSLRETIREPFNGNGEADTSAEGDDQQVIKVGELAAPGAIIVGPGANGVLDTFEQDDDEPVHDADGIRNRPVHGTSMATPVVSGFLANMIDMDPTLSPWPEATKALVICSAKRNVYDHAIEVYGDEVNWDPREGAGTIWIDEAKAIIDAGHYDKRVVDASDFPLVRTVSAKEGERFRYAIAWSSHTSGGTHENITNDVLEADLDIYVYDDDNNLVSFSVTIDNAYEVVAFDSPMHQNYHVEIEASRFEAAFEYLGEAWNASEPILRDCASDPGGLSGADVTQPLDASFTSASTSDNELGLAVTDSIDIAQPLFGDLDAMRYWGLSLQFDDETGEFVATCEVDDATGFDLSFFEDDGVGDNFQHGPLVADELGVVPAVTDTGIGFAFSTIFEYTVTFAPQVPNDDDAIAWVRVERLTGNSVDDEGDVDPCLWLWVNVLGYGDEARQDGAAPPELLNDFTFCLAATVACPWDCEAVPDGVVGASDLLALLAQWGTADTCDFDGGGVSTIDLLKLLVQWGPCP